MNSLKMIPRLARIFHDYKKRNVRASSMPIRLWVESSSYCNLRCQMCPNKDMSADLKNHMPLELFKKIVDEAKSFANDIYLHHRGEPFLNTSLFEMIKYAREAGIRTRFHTNGMLMTEDKAKALIEASPNLVSFSVDGFEKEPYEKIRPGAVFETTVANITRLAELRKDAGVKKPYIVVERIKFNNPETPENPEAIEKLKEQLLAAGVDEVITKDEYVWAEEDSPEACTERSSSACTFPWYAMVICADGTVTPCPQDFWANMKMGNVAEQSLAEIWNGEAYRDLRAQYVKDIEQLPLCRKCDRLHRKTVGGVPFQYMATFLIDQIAGYGKLRKVFGTSERN